jgi:hypothetical protein
VPPAHQQAVEFNSRARRLLKEGHPEEAKKLFHRAAELELQVLRAMKSQPERSLIAELGARAALQAGRFDLARDLVRRGASRAPEELQWALLRTSIQVELAEFLEEFERGWQTPWEPVDEEETRILMVSPSRRRLVMELDPDAFDVAAKSSNRDELVLVIPASRPARRELDALDALVTPWLRPRRHAQPVLEQRGIMDHFLLDLVPA